ncbi:hypothetical protein [Ktedonobacter sp. SOSP1-52]|uniref:hypothetical protein n=1 Tax=Ktedonobacter sp. SOSP1-52 TaxID=2778366 RepID=UPI001915782E|nr:hypothetical protein [Ktedonobacter sp. SOSP1-52]
MTSVPPSPALSRYEFTTLVKGRAWRHRLLRAPGMSTLVAAPASLKLPGDA